jgi:hypothetical protein
VTSSPLPYPWNGNARIPGGAEPLLGGTIVARYEGDAVIDGSYAVVVTDGGRELARTPVDFASLR